MGGVDGTTTVANPYHYADNDPLNKVDPAGKRPKDLNFSGPSDEFVNACLQLYEIAPFLQAPGALYLLQQCIDAGIRSGQTQPTSTTTTTVTTTTGG